MTAGSKLWDKSYDPELSFSLHPQGFTMAIWRWQVWLWWSDGS